MVSSEKTSKFSLSLGRVIWFLTLSDIFTWGLYLVINAFVGLYLAQRFGTEALTMVGIGAAFYYSARVITQIPIGILSDKIKKDRDDITLLFLGNLLMGGPYLLYPTINSPLSFYILQFLIGFGSAMNLVNWRKLFAANLQKNQEGITYAIYDSILSLAMIIFSVIAGYVASISHEFFDLVMMLVGIIMISSGFWAILIFFDKKRRSL